MTVRLLVRHSLLVGLVASLTSLGGFGCADDKSKSSLMPGGPPKILQVFVLDPNSSDDLFGSGYALTYGIHSDAWKCGVADDDCGNDPATGDPLVCFDEANGASKTDPLFLHCVTDLTSKELPIATSAIVTGASIRIISKELLNGQTLEQFACACHGNCTGPEWSIDPQNCSACGENDATTIVEAARCLDVNNDRVPDLATLQAGIATITCAGVPSFGNPTAGGGPGVYKTIQGDGYYYPNGNQSSPAATGYLGLGPAIVIEPQVVLPTSATCTISVAASVLDKNDRAPFDPTNGPVTFQTEPLAIVGSTPEDGDEMAEITDTIEIDFNANIDSGSVSPTTTGVRVAGTTTFLPLVPGTGTMPNPDVAANVVTLTLAADLLPSTDYEIIVDGAITDEYGQPFGDDATITFTTAAM